ncbi:unnamed protein product [Polarella glacialis]|uniref:Uncharacterized protein n=1 Tax=Polarella glacialis TaxID=89957 RepID=A0A813INB7_POLGL|nr:unnamed protein product [Polarella glacialis]
METTVASTSAQAMAGSFSSGVGVKGDELQTWAYLLLQDRLSTAGAFTICDNDFSDQGYSIRYASLGFCDLFEYSAMERVGHRCCSLYGLFARQCLGLRKVAKCIRNVKKNAVDMTLEDIQQGIRFAHDYVAKECRATKGTWDTPSSRLGYAVLAARKKSGAVFVCEIVISNRTEPCTGWQYTVILHRDISDEVPLRQFLQAARPGGGFEELTQKCKSKMHERLTVLDIDTRSSVLYFQEKVRELWTDKFKDVQWKQKLSFPTSRNYCSGEADS